MIRYIRHNEIDYEKWNKAVASSCYESPYGYAWYLDLAAENWDALVMDDYQVVMPLVWKKKIVIAHLYQPLNTQQLGIFSPDPPGGKMTREFLEKIPDRFLHADICFNQSNHQISEILPAEKRANYEISLGNDYRQLSEKYHTNTRRNLTKAMQAGLQVGYSDVDKFLALKSARDPFPFRRSRCERLHGLLTGILENEQGTIRAAYAGNTLAAAVFWLYSDSRIIYLLPVSDKPGREYRAMFLLVDHLIREQSGTRRILDFEGSNIPSIARFFEGFGAARKDYFKITLTHHRLKYLLNR